MRGPRLRSASAGRPNTVEGEHVYVSCTGSHLIYELIEREKDTDTFI